MRLVLADPSILADVLQDMRKILGVTLHMNHVSLLLGHPCEDSIVGACSNRLYDMLAYAARKKYFPAMDKREISH